MIREPSQCVKRFFPKKPDRDPVADRPCPPPRVGESSSRKPSIRAVSCTPAPRQINGLGPLFLRRKVARSDVEFALHIYLVGALAPMTLARAFAADLEFGMCRSGRRRLWVGSLENGRSSRSRAPVGRRPTRKVGPAVRIRFAPAASPLRTSRQSHRQGRGYSAGCSSVLSHQLGESRRRWRPVIFNRRFVSSVVNQRYV
jgi:hypothetical protein